MIFEKRRRFLFQFGFHGHFCGAVKERTLDTEYSELALFVVSVVAANERFQHDGERACNRGVRAVDGGRAHGERVAIKLPKLTGEEEVLSSAPQQDPG